MPQVRELKRENIAKFVGYIGLRSRGRANETKTLRDVLWVNENKKEKEIADQLSGRFVRNGYRAVTEQVTAKLGQEESGVERRGRAGFVLFLVTDFSQLSPVFPEPRGLMDPKKITRGASIFFFKNQLHLNNNNKF